MNRYLFMLLVTGVAIVEAQPFLLQKPKTITQEEVDTLPRSWQACFLGTEGYCASFLYDEGKTALQVTSGKEKLYESPSWKLLQKEEQKSFDGTCGPEEDSCYYLGKVRKLDASNNVPRIMTVEEIGTYIKNKRFVFYTGAGVSLSSGVQAMAGLKNVLGFHQGLRLGPEYAEYAKTNEQAVLEEFSQFCHRAFTAEPTAAHRAIVTIALTKKIQVMTENFDFLHQRSGILPFCVSAESVRKQLPTDELQSIDALICVGMSADDRGLLQWYKDQNPQGKIIAFNLEVPQYVGQDDYVVLGDVQKTLPAVLASMNN
jgi:NAD-dependent SIR2 family protein deacetylase